MDFADGEFFGSVFFEPVDDAEGVLVAFLGFPLAGDVADVVEEVFGDFDGLVDGGLVDVVAWFVPGDVE